MTAATSLPYPDRLPPPAETAVALNKVLAHLYPDPTPDIFTLSDFQRRYPLTRLGEPAAQAIAQSQRINQAIGDYRQVGLCAFHIGLIFLHSGDSRGAAQQFAEARRQWQFADHAGSVALGYFAEAQAQEYAHHFEAAMSLYQKTEQWLARVDMKGLMAERPFVTLLQDALTASRQALRRHLWPPEPEKAAAAEAGETVETAVTPASSPVPPASSPPPAIISPPKHTEPTAATMPEDVETGHIPPPSSNLEPRPQDQFIPGHVRTSQLYDWYQVSQGQNTLFPELSVGTWLLVRRQPDPEHFTEGEQVLVVIDTHINDGILVKPQTPRQQPSRIYLGRIHEITGSFTRDIASGKVTLSPDMTPLDVTPREILGIVEGIWVRLAHAGAES